MLCAISRSSVLQTFSRATTLNKRRKASPLIRITSRSAVSIWKQYGALCLLTLSNYCVGCRPAPWQIFFNAPTAKLGANSTLGYNILPFLRAKVVYPADLFFCDCKLLYLLFHCLSCVISLLSCKCISFHVFLDVFYIPLSPFRRGVESGRSRSVTR